jgi:hypothetical protein
MLAAFTPVRSDGTSGATSNLAFERVEPGAQPTPERPPARVPEFAGRWRATQGASVMVIEDRGDGTFAISAGGQTSVARLSAAGRLEGTESHPEGNLAFAMELSDGRLVVRAAGTQPDGTPVEVPTVVFERATESAEPSGELDPALVGHWRFTQVVHFVKDFNVLLNADGTFRFWIRPDDDPPETGHWKTDNRRLYVRVEGGEWNFYGSYSTDGNNVVITFPDGDRRVYERQ